MSDDPRKIDPVDYSFVLFEKESTADERLALLNKGESRRSSWYISEKSFAPVLEKLRKEPLPRSAEAGLIYESSGKYVWKLQLPSPGGTITAAYKTNPGKTPLRYIFKSSLPIREVRNYFLFEKLQIPVAPVIAAGDQRKNFVLQETFIVTGFLENSRDGRQFMPGGSFRSQREKLKEFSRLNLELLAKLHHACVFHKAFHPRNLLWRENEGHMEIFWIDVARCRKVSRRRMAAAVIKDLHTFFRDMRLTREETVELIAHYTALAPAEFLPESNEKLLDKLIHFRRRLFSRKRFQLFSEE